MISQPLHCHTKNFLGIRQQGEGVIPKIKQSHLIVIWLPRQQSKRPIIPSGGSDYGLPLRRRRMLWPGGITIWRRELNDSRVNPVVWRKEEESPHHIIFAMAREKEEPMPRIAGTNGRGGCYDSTPAESAPSQAWCSSSADGTKFRPWFCDCKARKWGGGGADQIIISLSRLYCWAMPMNSYAAFQKKF